MDEYQAMLMANKIERDIDFCYTVWENMNNGCEWSESDTRKMLQAINLIHEVWAWCKCETNKGRRGAVLAVIGNGEIYIKVNKMCRGCLPTDAGKAFAEVLIDGMNDLGKANAMLYPKETDVGGDVQAFIQNAHEEPSSETGEPTADGGREFARYSLNGDRELATLQFKKLVKAGCFPKETSLNDWLYVYGISGAKPYNQPLDWQWSQTDLAYLIQEIWGDTDANRLWKVCERCFTVNGRVPNVNTMKAALSKINNKLNTTPDHFKVLREILLSN